MTLDTSAITFSLTKGEDGIITGFSLTAVETHAECFCVTFPFAQAKGKARVDFEDGKIRFVHDGISPDETPTQLGIYGGSEGGMYETDITPEDATALQDFLGKCGRYQGVKISFRPELAWGKGFSLKAELPQRSTSEHDAELHN